MIRSVQYESIHKPTAIPGMDDCQLIITDSVGDSLDSAFHWHLALEIVLIMQGSVIYTVDGESKITHAGEFHIINSRKIHSAINADTDQRVYAMVLLISDEYLRKVIPTEMRQQFVIDSCSETYNQIRRKLFQILDAGLDSRAHHNLKIISRVTELLTVLYDNCAVCECEEILYSGKIIDFINFHYAEAVSLEDVAKYVGLQKNYVCRCFKNEVGITFKQYLNHIRLDAALALLSSNNYTAQECAVQSGFSSEKQMINWCQKIYGTSPRQYVKSRQDIR